MDQQADFQGKKIVFTYPSELVRGPLMDLLTEREYEVYILKEHEKIPNIYKASPNAVFFLNIDTALNEAEWQVYIRELNSRCPGISLGILSFRITEQNQMQHYLLELGISCGFIQLKQGAKVAGEMMLKVLAANEVKGRRKYLRYQCGNDDRTVVRFSAGGEDMTGKIQDISSVGMSCFLDSDAPLVKNQLVRNMQLRLKGVIVSCDAILMGTRKAAGQGLLYVFLFRMDSLDKMKTRIRSYIYASFQKQFNHDFSLSD